MNTALPGWIFLAVVLSLVPHDMMWGPQAALIAECFTPRRHYSGFSLGVHLSSVTAGGPAPLIATALLAVTGSGYVIALYILFSAAVSVITTVFLPDRANRDISEEPAYGNRGRAGRRKLKIGAGPCGGGGSVPYTHGDAIISIIKPLYRACRARFGPAVKFRCQSAADLTKFRCRPVSSDPGQPSDRQKIFEV